MSNIRLDKLTRQQINEITRDSIVVLPIGATEQHGPHLPLSVDNLIITEVAKRACLQLKNELQIYSAPVINYGNSHHHLPYPALSLSSETVLQVLKDLLRSLAITGFQKIMILNSHGGNDEALRIATRDISREEQICIGAASYWSLSWDSLANAEALYSGRVPGHAGGFETSLMLALAPEEVQLDNLPDKWKHEIPPSQKQTSKRLFIQKPGQSVGKEGISDDASQASKDKGEQFLEIIVKDVCHSIKLFNNQCIKE
ncbi:creatininase family protein [Natribacillus halophilus]|uniref:Creatinine amidohydrolase n=1 Tax=Natribacillus halophilus TaxID=549003 RepID=A0A1G8RCX2_9BACI|nr:creatininase family protein [Natribacillus halophilus]SDJ14798.1 creatinine amidohydrolase [Natribacillus halophilus]